MDSGSTSGSVPRTIIDIQKELYRKALYSEAFTKKGSNSYPFNIEPFGPERDRLALPFTDEDRALRKQWLKDQVLSEREPVYVPEYSRVNIFRRLYRMPYDALANVVRPVFGVSVANTFRFCFPKIMGGLTITWLLWYHIKYSGRVRPYFISIFQTWETGLKGIKVYRGSRPVTYPGDPQFPGPSYADDQYALEGFYQRKSFLGEKLVTSGA
ncbi:unnamed protein product [Protopolystoma xenopodis]|uniref:Uncharacterized protein n=1 Tax=Protopolystoma xenopodis TaxID=117903 RepID=A0A3S5CUE0_9PLAT|nr:unnamed protein product [Protopolystoma xenopodis]